MRKIFIYLLIIGSLSCQDDNNLLTDIAFNGGLVLFESTPNLVHDIEGVNEAVISAVIEDPTNNALSYAVAIQTSEGLTSTLATLTSFPEVLLITRPMILNALNLTNIEDLPNSVTFVGTVTTADGIFTGETIDFDIDTNTQNGGNTALNLFNNPRQALKFTTVLFQQFKAGELTVTPIRDGDDDVEEVAFNPDPVPPGDSVGTMDLGSSDLELGETSSDDGVQHIGLRFNLIGIPSGVTITNANIQFESDTNGSNPVEYIIYGEAVGNSEPFEDRLNNITNRSLTSSNIVWNIPGWNRDDKGPEQLTVDISSIIQEIIDRDDWVPANSITIIMLASGVSLEATTRSGGREAKTFNDDAAPELLLRYTN